MNRRTTTRNMKRIILFRFHTEVGICENRLKLLNKHNPEVKIFGLFGGQEEDLETFQGKLNPYLESIYCIRGKRPSWKRTHGDLALRMWYEDVGKTLSFDILYFIEWDLLLFEPLEKIYGHIPENGVGLTSLTSLKDIEGQWFWLSNESFRIQWHDLLRFVKDKYGYDQDPLACEFSGACMPREFLEKYSNAEIPEFCHDELRIPLFCQVFNFKCYNTNLCRAWFDAAEQKLFNCDNKEIRLSTITEELAKQSGRRAFHPVRKMFNFDKTDSLINRISGLKAFFRVSMAPDDKRNGAI